MKLFHLSDLHLGRKLFRHDLIEDQAYILEQIVAYAKQEKPDAIVIAGDVYDKAIPPVEAVELFDRFLLSLTRELSEIQILVISGNHDSAPRVNQYRGILKEQKVHMVGTAPEKKEDFIEKLVLEDAYGPINFFLLPFIKPSMVKEIVGSDLNGNNLSYNESVRAMILREKIDSQERNVFVSHQFYLPVGEKAENMERMDSEIRTVGNIDEVKADILEAFDYAALGHIHKPMSVGSEFIRYCGTPLACSVSEAGQKKGIIVVELAEKGKRSTRVLPLKPLRELRVLEGSLNELVKLACDDYVTVVLTEQKDLDVIDLQDRIRYAFPRLLEIRRSYEWKARYKSEELREKEQDPLELCMSFLGEMEEEDQAFLKEVILAAEGVM